MTYVLIAFFIIIALGWFLTCCIMKDSANRDRVQNEMLRKEEKKREGITYSSAYWRRGERRKR